MKKKIVIAIIIAFFVGPQVACPLPDPLTGLVGGAMAAVFCAVPLLILARFAFVKTASKPVHTLICSLVCVIAILLLTCYMFILSLRSQERFYRSMRTSSASVRVDNTSHDAPAL